MLKDLFDFLRNEKIAFAVIGAFALKLFAMRNHPQRGLQDMADIQQLLRATPVDRDEVPGYFKKYGQIDKYEQLTGKTE